MNPLRLAALLLFSMTLAGCDALRGPGERVLLLVLVPAAIIVGMLYLVRRRGEGRDQGRGPRYPDHDERD